MGCSVAIAVEDASQVGEARRAAAQLAKESGLSETEAGKVAIIASELANNLQRYARQGRIIIQSLATLRGTAVEVLSIDAGPGMADVNQCLKDGYSTGGTPGSGLGAVKRLSSEFDIFSTPPEGTVVLSRVYADPNACQRPAALAWGGISVPAPGERVCGDAWRIIERPDGAAILVADGLGHGPLAGEAADVAVGVFEADESQGPAQYIELAHKRMSGTRGAAIAAAQLNIDARTLRYAGVGNISGTLMTAVEKRGLVTHNGIVGSQLRKAQELEYAWLPVTLLVMHSDGLRSHWTLDRYPEVFSRHPGVIAAVLLRDFTRGRDDVTVIALRLQMGQA